MTDDLTKILRAHAGHCPKGRRARIRFLALALAGEAGELANQVKKEWRGDDKSPRAQKRRLKNMRAETIDVANYAFMLAHVLGVENMPAAMLQKFQAVERRKKFKHYGRRIAKPAKKPTHFSRRKLRQVIRGQSSSARTSEDCGIRFGGF